MSHERFWPYDTRHALLSAKKTSRQRAASCGGRPHRRTKTEFAKLSRRAPPRRARKLAIHSEVVVTDLSLGMPFGAEVCPPSVSLTNDKLRAVGVADAVSVVSGPTSRFASSVCKRVTAPGRMNGRSRDSSSSLVFGVDTP